MLYQLLRLKRVIEEDEYLRESVSWGWVLEGKGKGILIEDKKLGTDWED